MTARFTLHMNFGGDPDGEHCRRGDHRILGNPNAAFSGNYTVEGCPPQTITDKSDGGPSCRATTDTGNHTDDGTTLVTLPFSFRLVRSDYTGVNVNSNGKAQFTTYPLHDVFQHLPAVGHPTDVSIPYWDDLRTDAGAGLHTRSHAASSLPPQGHP